MIEIEEERSSPLILNGLVLEVNSFQLFPPSSEYSTESVGQSYADGIAAFTTTVLEYRTTLLIVGDSGTETIFPITSFEGALQPAGLQSRILATYSWPKFKFCATR